MDQQCIANFGLAALSTRREKLTASGSWRLNDQAVSATSAEFQASTVPLYSGGKRTVTMDQSSLYTIKVAKETVNRMSQIARSGTTVDPPRDGRVPPVCVIRDQV